jgi:hypothetical protein
MKNEQVFFYTPSGVCQFLTRGIEDAEGERVAGEGIYFCEISQFLRIFSEKRLTFS